MILHSKDRDTQTKMNKDLSKVAIVGKTNQAT